MTDVHMEVSDEIRDDDIAAEEQPAAIDRRKVKGRRIVKFTCIGCLSADLNAVQHAHDRGTMTVLGNWSAGQILQHCAKLIQFALDGFPSKAPWIVRFLFTTFLKKRALKDIPMDPGMNLPKQAAFMLPSDDVSFDQGMQDMRDVVARLKAGNRMEQPSPILGELTHDQWMGMVLRHCAMHHSFIALEPVQQDVSSPSDASTAA